MRSFRSVSVPLTSPLQSTRYGNTLRLGLHTFQQLVSALAGIVAKGNKLEGTILGGRLASASSRTSQSDGTAVLLPTYGMADLSVGVEHTTESLQCQLAVPSALNKAKRDPTVQKCVAFS